jgi:hypothetical protein
MNWLENISSESPILNPQSSIPNPQSSILNPKPEYSQMTNERDRLMADLAKARLTSTDLKAMAEERDRAVNDVSSARKEVKLLIEKEAEARRINEGLSIELRDAKLALQKVILRPQPDMLNTLVRKYTRAHTDGNTWAQSFDLAPGQFFARSRKLSFFI